MDKIELKNDEKMKIEDVFGMILTKNVHITTEQYEEMMKSVALNYDANNEEKGTEPTLEEKRTRVEQNFYGTVVNFLYQILNITNSFANNYGQLIEAIAEKVGVDFEKVESEEDKAMKAATEYLNERTRARRVERELKEKQLLNREQRRKAKIK